MSKNKADNENGEEKEIHRTSIGGQAVIEGVMMQGAEKTCIAVRNPEGQIVIEELKKENKYKALKKIPILRGIVSFLSGLSLGFKSINRSAEIAMTQEELEADASKFDKYIEKKLGDKAQSVITGISIFLALVIAVSLFVILPFYVAKGVEWLLDTKLKFWFNVVEGVFRIFVFILYIVLIRRVKEIKRLFAYHGAEHKTVHCYEHGKPLTEENIRKYSTLHKRCGTNFLLIVMIVSILIFSFLNIGNPLLRIVLRVLMFPLVAGVSYEVIKLTGKYDNWLTAAVCAPGMWLQRLTTSEPDSGQIEVASTVLSAVLTNNKEDDKW